MHDTLIPARSKRQVMDWSLVLASQDIPATIVQSPETGWGLLVEAYEHERALAAIHQYRVENRRWAWRQPLPWSETTFHWGSLGWSIFLALIQWLTATRWPGFPEAAQFDTHLVRAGQWWRAFTAILIHADLAHLLGNLSIGFVLLGLAMARYGGGVGLLAAYLAGASGNALGLVLYPHPYVGVGASGMVMGALGLVAIPRLRQWAHWPIAWKQVLQAVFAAVLLFVLLGVDPKSDVIAHLGGFVSGALFGLILNLLGERVVQGKLFNALSWVAVYGLLVTTTWLALRTP